MATFLTIARPYAKAIFNLALKQDQFLLWRDALKTLAKVAKECEKNKLLTNPQITANEKINFFIDVVGLYPEAVMGLVKLLAARKKLFLLPDIATNFQQLFFAYNGILEVKVVSAYELNAAQKEQLVAAVKQRYQNEILLQYQVDSALIGGAIIYLNDKVIDFSLKGLLERLRQRLLLKNIGIDINNQA